MPSEMEPSNSEYSQTCPVSSGEKMVDTVHDQKFVLRHIEECG